MSDKLCRFVSPALLGASESPFIRKTPDGLLFLDYHPDQDTLCGHDTGVEFDMILPELIRSERISWVGFSLNVQEEGQKDPCYSGYNILFQHDSVELVKWGDQASYKKFFFGGAHENPVHGFLPCDLIRPRVRHSIRAGAVDDVEGVRIFLYIDGTLIFDIVDTEDPYRNGFFSLLGMSHSVVLLPFTDIRRTSDRLEFHVPLGKFYPYPDSNRDYLIDDNPEVCVSDYTGSGYLIPLTLTWECTRDDIVSYTLQWSREPAYKEGFSVTLDGSCHSHDIYNLYKGTHYYCRLTAVAKDGTVLCEDRSFKTTDLGPRVIRVEGIHNVREMGGYMTSFGRRTAQGLLFRCATLEEVNYLEDGFSFRPLITEAGIACMTKELGIRTQVDLRGDYECGMRTESPLPGVKYFRFPIRGYHDCMELTREPLREIFRVFADRNNYPLFYHCLGGADRTGTVGYLTGALLGMNERDLAHDYAYTTYSKAHYRTTVEGYADRQFLPMKEYLAKYPGTCLAEKAENYLLSIGVTAEEIASIREILLV